MNDRPSLISRVFGSRGLKGISEIRTFFRTNEQPIFFFGPTAFNLLGIDRWVRGVEYIVYYDSWDGSHPRVFTPSSNTAECTVVETSDGVIDTTGTGGRDG